MAEALFRFYAELNDFLSPDRRQVGFIHHFEGRVSIKDMIEALGVPHTEIDLILINGESVDFSVLVQDGDRISVYPVFESFDIAPLLRVRPKPLRDPRYVLDVHLGKLAAYMRLLGFDTLYRNDYEDAELACISRDERRTLLTRDRGLLKRSLVTYGYCLRTKDSKEQVTAVLHRYHLHDQINPWSRCLRCNGRLQPVAKEAILHRLEPKTKLYFNNFQICADCEQIYWRGSHFGKLEALITAVTNSQPPFA